MFCHNFATMFIMQKSNIWNLVIEDIESQYETRLFRIWINYQKEKAFFSEKLSILGSSLNNKFTSLKIRRINSPEEISSAKVLFDKAKDNCNVVVSFDITMVVSEFDFQNQNKSFLYWRAVLDWNKE